MITYKIKVNSPALGECANRRLIDILFKYFNVPRSYVKIIEILSIE